MAIVRSINERISLMPTARVVSRALTSIGVALIAAAPAQAAPYQTTFGYERCYGQVLESGQRMNQQFVMNNVGTNTWTPDVLHLGLIGPRDRTSVFYDKSWSSPTRPAILKEASVAPGTRGTFEFIIQAPKVNSATSYNEAFGLVAEGVTWMDGASGLGPDLGLPWTVKPAEKPTVDIASAPSSVLRGDPITITAHATDNVDVDHVEISIDNTTKNGKPPQATDYCTLPTAYDAEQTFDSTPLTPGTHDIWATVHDGIDQTATKKSSIVIRERPVPSVETGAASAITTTSASVVGTVNPNGASATAHFEYGLTKAYGSVTPDVALPAGSSATPVGASLSGLRPGKTYHYRLVASNLGGPATGGDATFKTVKPPKAPPPAVVRPFFVGAVSENGHDVLKVAPVEGGSSITVTCLRRCPKPNLGHARSTKGTSAKIRLRRRVVNSRARFEVDVKVPGKIGRYLILQADHSGQFSVVDRGCLIQGSRGSCPS